MASAIEFKGMNCIYAKDQPEYLPLPVFKDDNGTTISCWQFAEEEIEELKRNGGKCYLQILTFNQPLQPVLIVAKLEDLLELK
jgi:hypothetical protein